jgi:hypothetical protein
VRLQAKQAAINQHIEEAAEHIIDELENFDDNIPVDEIDNISDRSFEI